MDHSQETELVALRASGDLAGPASSIGPRASVVIDTFFEDLRLKHSGGDRGGPRFASPRSRPSSLSPEDDLGVATPSSSSRAPRGNQRRLYVDDEQRLAAVAASRRHLEKHKDWLFGPLAISDEELRSRIALQHFTSIDVEDLRLPQEQRRADDTFTEEGISHQFLLDAGRSEFALPGGIGLCFRREVEARGICLEENPLEVEHLLRSFEGQLVRALLGCLGPSAPLELVQAVSRAMSQSGMANLERACQGPQIVVSGGEQSLRYELLEIPGSGWEVRAMMRKYTFERFVVVHEAGLDDPGKAEVLECSPDSQILRSCTILYTAGPASEHGFPREVVADVRGVVDRVELLDSSGQMIQLDVSGHSCQDDEEQAAWKAALARHALSLAQCFSSRSPLRVYAGSLVSQAAARCRFCRRRARGAVDSAVQLPRRMVSGIEEADAAIRMPLRD